MRRGSASIYDWKLQAREDNDPEVCKLQGSENEDAWLMKLPNRSFWFTPHILGVITTYI